MLHARLAVDLPSEPLPRTSRIKRLLLSLVTDTGADDDRERLLGNALELLSTTLQAFAEVGIRDVVAIRVGEHGVYIDNEQRLGDLDEALEHVVASGRLTPGFGVVKVVLSHVAEGLHTVAEVALDEEVARGTAPLRVELVGRISELRIRPDQSPPEYRTRVDAWLAEGGLDRMLDQASALTHRLSSGLSRALHQASVHVEGPDLRVVAPGPVQVARLRHLGFRQRLRPQTHRPDPTHRRRSPAYDHLHVHYYFDPYHDLLSWLVLEALLDDRAVIDRVTVVDPDGTTLFELDDLTDLPEHVELPVPRDAVRLEESTITVDQSIPELGLDVAEVGSPHTPGYGGEGSG